MAYPDIWGTNHVSFLMDKEPSSAYLTLGRTARSYNIDLENLFYLLHRG